eukprot:Rhum_TRINITY_DN15845_c0_g1::Rhum_TRINITY_DN15845_c0_g1_i1::g.162256::m.162256
MSGYRKVGRVLFVTLRRCAITRWSSDTRVAAYQLGLTAINKCVVMPDLPENRDLLLKVYPWVDITAKDTDTVREMLKVPDGISWQELRDNIPEPEIPYTNIASLTVKSRVRFQRELMWLKEEMRERVGVDFVKPTDRTDPSEPSNTLFLFDNAAKEYWKMYTKEKMVKDRRFARFYPTPARGFDNPATKEAMGIFFPRMGRGENGMTMHTRGLPMAGTTATSRWNRVMGRPIAKMFSPNTDSMTPQAKGAVNFNVPSAWA